MSERGLLESFRAAGGASAGAVSWDMAVTRVRTRGIENWLRETLAAAAKVIAGALNVLGVHRVVVTGLLTELPGAVEYLDHEIRSGALWARFGQVVCQAVPRCRTAGLVAAGLDRLVLPLGEEKGMV